jgi:gamma-glutamyltranspeptidase
MPVIVEHADGRVSAQGAMGGRAQPQIHLQLLRYPDNGPVWSAQRDSQRRTYSTPAATMLVRRATATATSRATTTVAAMTVMVLSFVWGGTAGIAGA